MQNLSYDNKFDLLRENETVGGIHFHKNGLFLPRDVLTQSLKVTRNFFNIFSSWFPNQLLTFPHGTGSGVFQLNSQ